MKQSINKSILFMKSNSEGRVVVIIRSKDNRNSPIHTDEIYLPLKHLNNPSTSIKDDFRHEHHYFASACQALHHLCSYKQNAEYENDELEMATITTMFNRTLAIVNRSIRTMKLIKSKYFTTISGSNTLAMLASMLETFPEGKSILFDIMKTDELHINLFSYLGTGSFSALTDTILFLQERGNGDLLLKSCKKLSYLQISPEILTVLPSEANDEMNMLTLHKMMEPDFRDLETHSTKEQIAKYTNHWFLDGWLSLSFYWWSIYMIYGIKGKIMRWWHRIKMIKWVKLAIHFFAPNGGMTNPSLIRLCVVPLDQFNSYSEFPVDRHKDNNDVGDSSFIERWLYEILGGQTIKLAQDAGILYKQKESDAVIPYKNISAFIQSATNQHENDVLFQGESVFEAMILHKWKKFARKRFFAMYLICFTYYISYTLSVLFSRETFGYTLGTTITNNRGHLACISLMFITGGLLFIQETRQFSKSRSRFAYLTSPYNVLDILACVLPAISFWQVINNYAGIGITLETIIQLIRSVYKVLFIMLLVIFAFTHAFMVLLSHKEDSFFQEQYKGSVNLRSSGEAFSDENEVTFHDTSANNNFGNPFKAFSIVWFFVWGVWDPINDGDAGDDYMVILLAIMFSLLAILLFINLIIALMSSKVEEVKKRGKKVWISHFAAVVAEIELLWCTKSERRSRNNNPAFVYYVAKRSDIMYQRESLKTENDLLIQKIRAQIEAANEKSLNYQIFDSITELSSICKSDCFDPDRLHFKLPLSSKLDRRHKRTAFVKYVVPALKYLSQETGYTVMSWCEKEIETQILSNLQGNNYSTSACDTKYADDLGVNSSTNKEELFTESSSRISRENVAHSDGTIKLITKCSGALQHLIQKHPNASINTMCLKEVHGLQIIKNQATLTKVSLCKESKKWSVVEVRSSEIPVDWVSHSYWLLMFELMATLVLAQSKQEHVNDMLINESTGFSPRSSSTEGSLGWFNVHIVFVAFFDRRSKASTIKSTVTIETTIKVLGHANILLDIATNDSFKDENEGDAVESKANNNGTANAVQAKVISGHAEQEAIDQMLLPYLQLQITGKFEYI
ncbi:hypothetical protein MAM1_0043d03039 [Mucor ambiguus]|uniref:Ion transport domain-containing protein n=1 Tax=Mucor ambiguus TaxID=91626 RepID=A0A0C9M8S8_9FUNG|nr:hypothetical protein MAM1_0043d03039 [Mucor ambiguus]